MNFHKKLMHRYVAVKEDGNWCVKDQRTRTIVKNCGYKFYAKAEARKLNRG